ncbi:MAG: hypothetical protein GX991_06520 [Clostridiaceae bacterium]|nr:hypothetical protein [Clostridiaceae bacterium]
MEYKISDVILESGSGATPSRKFPEYYGGNILWLKTKELNDGRVYDTEEKITDKGFANSSVKLFPINTVTIAMYGATVGKLGILKKEMTTNQACCNLVANPDKCDYRFLFYYLLNNRKAIVSLANGAAQHNINQQIVRDFPFPVIDLAVQQRVAGLISSFDHKIELNNKIIANLEAQAQAIFKSWFVDFEPFQDRAFIESELGLIPEGWMVSTIGREFDIEYGKNLPTKHLSEKGYPVFGGNGQIGFYKEYLYEKPRILVSCRGAASGKVGLSKPYSYVTNNSLVFNEKREEYFYYFKYMFNGIQFENYVTGSAQPQLTIANSKDIKILIPKKEIAIMFNIIIGSYFTNQLTLSEQNRTLAQIRDMLLPKLMSGEIDVNNIKIDSEEIGHV